MTRTVASIYFEPRELHRPLYGGSFHAPAVPKNSKPFLLEVRDHVQLEKLPNIVGGGRFPRQIFGEHIAADIVQHWASGALGMTGDCHPGVWVVRDVITITDETGLPLKDQFGVVQTRPATDEEKASMWQADLEENTRAQKKWADWLVSQADALESDENRAMRILISPLMRSACKWLGRERAWETELKDLDAKTCQFCLRSLDIRAVKCQHCGEIVDRAEYDRLIGVAKAVGQMSGPSKSPLPPPVQSPSKQHAL